MAAAKPVILSQLKNSANDSGNKDKKDKKENIDNGAASGGSGGAPAIPAPGGSGGAPAIAAPVSSTTPASKPAIPYDDLCQFFSVPQTSWGSDIQLFSKALKGAFTAKNISHDNIAFIQHWDGKKLSSVNAPENVEAMVLSFKEENIEMGFILNGVSSETIYGCLDRVRRTLSDSSFNGMKDKIRLKYGEPGVKFIEEIDAALNFQAQESTSAQEILDALKKTAGALLAKTYGMELDTVMNSFPSFAELIADVNQEKTQSSKPSLK